MPFFFRCDMVRHLDKLLQEGLALASIARDVVVEMTPPRDDNPQ